MKVTQTTQLTAAEYVKTAQQGDRVNGQLVSHAIVTGRLASTYTVYVYGGDPLHFIGSDVLTLVREVEIEDATPAEIDTRLAELERKSDELTRDIALTMTDLRVALGQQQERVKLRNGRHEYVWLISSYDTERNAVAVMQENPYGAENVHAAWDLLQEYRRRVLVVRQETTQIGVEFARRGGWTRVWVVPGGHAHTSRSCSTCYPTTLFQWVPSLSGHSEEEIVELAGERACTICYPSAPVNVLARPTRLFSDEEKLDQAAKDAAAAEKAAKKAAAKAAEIVVENWQEWGRSRDRTFKSTRALTNAIAEELTSLCWYGVSHPSGAEWLANVEAGRKALADAGIDYDYDKALKAARKKASEPKF